MMITSNFFFGKSCIRSLSCVVQPLEVYGPDSLSTLFQLVYAHMHSTILRQHGQDICAIYSERGVYLLWRVIKVGCCLR